MFTLRYGAASAAGRIRAHNEDSLLCGPRIFAVADGVGGHAAGDVASVIATSLLGELATRADLRTDDVLDGIRRANNEILADAAGQPQHRGMATTITGLALVRVGGIEHWMVFNVGDSRVYHFVGDRLVQVSVDHSEVQELRDAGVLSGDQARTFTGRNVITRSLGTDPAPVADVWVLPTFTGERFLVCSDGLDIELTADEIATILRREAAPQQAADDLVESAVRAGGRDNVTVVILDVLEQDAPAPDTTVIAESTAPRATLAGGER
jgi:PPM family protein phosphatase